jgi:hypothetical protein
MGVTESTLKGLDVAAAVVHGVQALVVIGLTVEVLDKRTPGMFNGGHNGVHRMATVYDAQGDWWGTGPGSCADHRLGWAARQNPFFSAFFFCSPNKLKIWDHIWNKVQSSVDGPESG